MREQVENIVSEHRAKMDITQEELAAQVNVSRQTIIAMERGNYTPSILLAMKVASFFEVPVEELFTIKHERKS